MLVIFLHRGIKWLFVGEKSSSLEDREKEILKESEVQNIKESKVTNQKTDKIVVKVKRQCPKYSNTILKAIGIQSTIIRFTKFGEKCYSYSGQIEDVWLDQVIEEPENPGANVF